MAIRNYDYSAIVENIRRVVYGGCVEDEALRAKWDAAFAVALSPRAVARRSSTALMNEFVRMEWVLFVNSMCECVQYGKNGQPLTEWERRVVCILCEDDGEDAEEYVRGAEVTDEDEDEERRLARMEDDQDEYYYWDDEDRKEELRLAKIEDAWDRCAERYDEDW